MQTTRRGSWLLIVVAAAFAVGAAPAAAHAAKLLVDSGGTDGGDCGGKPAPCRSISRAISNAGAGDTIIVGPGRYGDIDGDGNFFSPGDEHSGFGGTLILIDKPLTILSRDGAGSTVIDARELLVNVIIRVTGNNVTFGKSKQGFTIVGTLSSCSAAFLAATLMGQPTSNVVLAGNRATGCIDGFELNGTHRAVGNQATGNSNGGFQIINGTTAIGNEANNNGTYGMYLFGAGNLVTGNLMVANGGTGISLTPSSSGNLVTGNVASGNVTGFDVQGPDHTLSGNVAAANTVSGFFFNTNAALMTGNAVVANAVYGVQIGASSGAPTITKNNFIGNGRASGGPACGISNFSNAAIPATGNFWGAATGPGAVPADDVCNDAAGSFVTAPFATKPIKVKTKPPRIQ